MMRNWDFSKLPSHIWWLSCVLLLAWLLRLAPILANPERNGHPLDDLGDSLTYHRLAFHLATGKGYSAVRSPQSEGTDGEEPVYVPCVTRGPTYPVFLALAYRVVGVPTQSDDWPVTWNRVRLTQAWLDGLVCVWVFLIVRSLVPGFQGRAALASALLYALNPYTILYGQLILCESLTSFLMALGFLFVSVSRRLGARMAAGMCFAAVAMCRAEYTYYGFLMAILSTRGPGTRSRLKEAGAFLLGFLLLFTPWILHLGRATQRVTLTPVGGVWYNVFQGTFETNSNWNGFGVVPEGLLPEIRKRQVESLHNNWHLAFSEGLLESVKYDNEFRHVATEQFLKSPVSVLRCWIVRMPRLWYQDHIQMYTFWEPTGGFMMMLLTFCGLGLYHFPSRRVFVLATLPAYLALACLPLHIESGRFE